MANTLFIGKVYLCFDELPSTNDYARDLIAKSKPPEGTAVQAATQSAGRGQYGSHWLSAPGQNLTLSVILYPSWLNVSHSFLLSKAVALALRETILRLCRSNVLTKTPFKPEEVKVKWPNDIYIGKLKVAGILIQNTLSGQAIQSSIIGMGLNVNQEAFPPALKRAGSLAQAYGHTFDPELAIDTLFECLESRYLQLKSGQTEALSKAYQACLLGQGERRRFSNKAGEQFWGEIQGVEDEGHLVIRTAKGDEHFSVKEVQML